MRRVTRRKTRTAAETPEGEGKEGQNGGGEEKKGARKYKGGNQGFEMMTCQKKECQGRGAGDG